MDVLRWVADGCPDGVWPDFSFKRTAYALADRGLVVVDRRRRSSDVALTDGGRYYLEHKALSPAKASGASASSAAPTVRMPAMESLTVTPESLLAELHASAGTLTVSDPPAAVRAGYRSAISRAITDGLVPAGYGLRHQGRDRGDLVVRLARLEEAPARSAPHPAVPVLKTLGDCHAAVAILRDDPRLLGVQGDTTERALLIVQSIAAECSRRGYGFGLREDDQPSFQITVGEDSFPFLLSEELERREVVDSEQVAAARYAWQRVPSRVMQVPSGRLVLRLGAGYGSVAWADRRRWSLDQKLPDVFAEVARRASAASEARDRRELERRRRLLTWETAVPRARQACIDQFNRERLSQQVASFAEARAIREYCVRLDAVAAACDDASMARGISDWSAWARQQADRVDPVTNLEQLAFSVPDEIRPADLDKFMPRGMTAWHPPD